MGVTDIIAHLRFFTAECAFLAHDYLLIDNIGNNVPEYLQPVKIFPGIFLPGPRIFLIKNRPLWADRCLRQRIYVHRLVYPKMQG